MSSLFTTAIQQSGGRIPQVGHYARTTWTLALAVIAMIAGISTLNMLVANMGVAALHEVASPIMQQLARFGRQG
jgi:hypothetical protein